MDDHVRAFAVHERHHGRFVAQVDLVQGKAGVFERARNVRPFDRRIIVGVEVVQSHDISPRASKRSASEEPMNPATPVINTFAMRSILN